MPIRIGDSIPTFSGLNENGDLIHSDTILGKPCIIFFYPKDDTYLCTKEACSFRDANEEFLRKGITVIGISADSTEDHARFIQKHNLQYSLISDPDNHIRTLFGVPKGVLGLLPGRVTYCIDASGKVLAIINSSFSAEKHVQEALKAYS
jgi:peroxiredoxin Q/BCP